MQLASHGMRVATRNASNYIPHNASAVGSSRGIHIPTFARVHPRFLPSGQAQRLFTQSRNLLVKFFGHLTAPGLRIQTTTSFGHSLSTARGYASIQQGFSFPVRTALARPLPTHFLPRAPATVPRCVSQVGLGTARNFSSGRPIFQNLIENVPIAGRALYEADFDIQVRKERGMMRKSFKAKSPERLAGREMLKPTIQGKENMLISEQFQTLRETELDQYFAVPATPNVTTCLLIPLAPTPTSHVPLDPFPSTSPSLLPLQHLSSVHASHELHTLRVSSLFSRLDMANVWERQVRCSSFSHSGGAEGVCTMLKVEFVGWTKAKVRSVIGESGTGWCHLEEVRTSSEVPLGLDDSDDDDGDSFSDASSVLSGLAGDSSHANLMEVINAIDPAQSLVLPTLDFSFSSLPAPLPADTLSSTSSYDYSFSDMQSEPDFDPWLDSESSSDDLISSSWVGLPSTFGFSSQFVQRAEARLRDESRESVFN